MPDVIFDSTSQDEWIANLPERESEIYRTTPQQIADWDRDERRDFYKDIANSDYETGFGTFEEGFRSLHRQPTHAFNISLYAKAADILGRDPTGEEFYQWGRQFEGAEGGFEAAQDLFYAIADEEKSKEIPGDIPGPGDEDIPGGVDDGGVPIDEGGEPVDTGLEKGTPAWAGNEVTNIFQELFQRAPSQAELNHFGGLLIDEEDPWSEYEVGQALRQTTEFREIQDVEFREGIGPELEDITQRTFERAQPGILASYTRAGIQHSPALDFAMTDVLGKLAEKRESFLLPLQAQQYGGRQAGAAADYRTRLNEYLRNLAGERSQKDFFTRSLISSPRTPYRDPYAGFDGGGSQFPYAQAGGAVGSIWGPAGTAAGTAVGYGAQELFG